MKELQEYQAFILAWAEERGINNPETQYLKFLEEQGEYAKHKAKNECVKDDIGDMFVCLVILAKLEDKEILFKTADQYHSKPRDIIKFINTLLFWGGYAQRIVNELHYLAIDNNLTLIECVDHAWNEIKDRKGKTINGNFIKQE